MPVVPFSRTAKAKGAKALPPPPEPYALMAAAQMHAEGRLVEPNPAASPGPDERPS